jgi:hypothetical protein
MGEDDDHVALLRIDVHPGADAGEAAAVTEVRWPFEFRAVNPKPYSWSLE